MTWRRIQLAVAVLLACAGCGGGGHTASGPAPGGAATHVKLSAPEALLLDHDGNLYISEFNGARVTRIGADGRVTVVAGTGTRGYSGDRGSAAAARLSTPTGLALDGHGNLMIADYGNNVIRKVDPAGQITTFVRSTTLNHPIGLAFNAGDLYVADEGNASVLRVHPSGEFSFVAQSLQSSYLVFDRGGNLDISNTGDNTVIQLDRESVTSGRQVLSTIAGTGTRGFGGDGGPATGARLNFPYGLAIDADGNLYVADRLNDRVRKIDPDGIITTVAGTGVKGFAGDGGPATAAKLDSPVGLAIDGSGNLYIADQGNNRVRRVDKNGMITTIAGRGR